MNEEQVRAVQQWLIKARNDLRSAQRLLTAKPPLLDTAAYHCQQAAEKALKGYLTLHEAPIPQEPPAGAPVGGMPSL